MKKSLRRTTMTTRAQSFYLLAKPGIVYGNLLMLAGGYLFGSQRDIDPMGLLSAALGTALVIACGCVINNYLDQDIDAHMHRTKNRQLVTHQVSDTAALLYAILLGSVGFTVLGLGTNLLTVYLGGFGLIMYALVYTFAKRRTVHATLIGTIPGALPPAAGYVAATGSFDWSAGMLFLIMVFWQMVHFYAIAIFRKPDYKSAKIPVLPIVHGERVTKIHMSLYGMAFLLALFGFWQVSSAGILFVIVMLAMGIWWVAKILGGFTADNSQVWARTVFGRSLLLLPSLSVLLATSVWFS